MNERMIENYVDEIFRGVVPGEKVTEQKEELAVNIKERVQDYMRDGLSFDAAFETAKGIVGDTEELTAPFEKIRPGAGGFGSQTPPRPYPAGVTGAETPAAPSWVTPDTSGKRFKVSVSNYAFVAASPFIFVLIGFLQNAITNFIPFFGHLNWWAWGWVIIPGSAIICAGIALKYKIVALSPLVFVLVGLLQDGIGHYIPMFRFLNWWAWGWVIIPLAGLVAADIIKITRE